MGGKKKKEPTDHAASRNSQQRGRQDTGVCQQRAGAEQGGAGFMHRVETRPECPEDNLRELTGHPDPNCGNSQRRKKKKRERERISPLKALNHSMVCSQNKALSELSEES